jgi:hypothetical protein
MRGLWDKSACGRNPPTPTTSAPGLGPPLPHPHRDWAHPSHIRTGNGLTPLTSAPGRGALRSHLHQDWAHPAHICTGTGRTPLTSAPGLGSPGSHLHQDWAHPAHICTRTGLTRLTSAPGLGSPPSPICTAIWARPCHIGTGTCRLFHVVALQLQGLRRLGLLRGGVRSGRTFSPTYSADCGTP